MILKPGLAGNKIIIADRCNFISDYPYGMAAGVDHKTISGIHKVFVDPPKVDLAILYRCDWEVAQPRLFGDVEDGEQLKCRIESRGEDYFKRVIEIYDSMWSNQCDSCSCSEKLLSSTLSKYVDDTASVDASQPIEDVEDQTIFILKNFMEGFK
jgi:thymidylate kinase